MRADSKRLFPLLRIFLLFIVFATPSFAVETKPDTIQDQYRQAKYFFNQLKTDTTLGNKRSLWLKCSDNFQKVYLANPESELAPGSLFLLGHVYYRMYSRFLLPGDLNEATRYFTDCCRQFPRHRLADDSLVNLADISLNIKKKPEEAARYYQKILTDYPTGDMQTYAVEQLKILSSSYNIPLPKILLDNSLDHQAQLANILPVTYWSSSNYSRVIINASEPVTYSAQLLEKRGDKPRRLFIDFQKSYIEPRYRPPVPVADGLLQRIRTGQNTPETVRVVLDMESVSSYRIFSLPDPFRVVIDIRGESLAASREESGKQLSSIRKARIGEQPIVILKENRKHKFRQERSPAEKSRKTPEIAKTAPPQQEPESPSPPGREKYTLAQQLGLGVKRIVIDPGHGGKDPGATANGLKEKDIVLKLAKKLAAELSDEYGYEVLLTRTDDTFISLEERTAIANGNNADLFISLHCNAHRLTSVSGTEIYFLNLTDNPESMRVAAYENATSELQMSDLQDVLADIMKNSKIQESSRLARNIHSTFLKDLKTHKMHLRDLGVKQAPFYVLIGAEMPAVLVELAFISNSSDAEKLRNDSFLTESAESIGLGINQYIHSNFALK